jgi:hypothetical protein
MFTDKQRKDALEGLDDEKYQGGVAADVGSDSCCLGRCFEEIVPVDERVLCDFAVVAVSTGVEETFVVGVFAGVEDVVTVLAGPERGHRV